MTRFAGRAALITAGGRGIGKAVATELAKGGAAIALNDVEADRLEETAAELRALGAAVSTHPGSVIDQDFVPRMVADAVRAHGKVDLLLNNAGGGLPGVPWQEFAAGTVADFRSFVEFNLFSQVYVLHAALPGMLERGYGKVVCVSSVSAPLGQEGGSGYATGKAALSGLVASVAKEVARRGVNVNGVVLGNPPHPSRTPERQAFLDKLTHFNRVGRFDEFGKAIAFLLSDDASYMSGVMVPIDGGWLVPRMVE